MSAIAAGVVGLGACSHVDDHSLQWISDGSGGSYGIALSLPDHHRPITVLAGGLCRNGEDLATVTNVSFLDSASAMKVTGWATRFRAPNVTMSGADVGDLVASGYDPASKDVDARCATLQEGSTDLAIQVEAAGAGRFTSSELLVEYSVNSSRGSVHLPLTLVLCVDYPKEAQCDGV